jgi:hypothetical protein
VSDQDSYGGPGPAAEWVVREIRGRGASREKGLATAHAVTLQGPGDAEFVLGRLERSQERLDIEILALAQPMNFDRCPICSERTPTSKEQVPPAAIGGAAMTTSCTRCNNELGSRLEAPLIDWLEDAVGSVSLSHDEVRGARRASRELLRPGNRCSWWAASTRRSAADSVRARFSMSFTEPDHPRYRLAALKNAYLGACLLLRSMPQTPESVAIRAELVAARELGRKQPVKVSSLCARQQIWKSHGPAVPGEIALTRTQPSDAATPIIAVSLARTLMVSWPVGGYLVTADSDGTPTAAYRL